MISVAPLVKSSRKPNDQSTHYVQILQISAVERQKRIPPSPPPPPNGKLTAAAHRCH